MSALRHARLLHRHRLPTTVTADEDSGVADPAAERVAPECTGVVGDALEDRNISIDPYHETVVAHGGQFQLATRDVTDVVAFGPAGTEPGYLHEFVGDHSGQGDRICLEEGLPASYLDRAYRVLGSRGRGRSLCGKPCSVGAKQQECDHRPMLELEGHQVAALIQRHLSPHACRGTTAAPAPHALTARRLAANLPVFSCLAE